MKTNKIDNNIKKKFENRTVEPSVSAWERLSVQLDEQPQKKKKGWFFYIGYAASILALISVGLYTFSDDNQPIIPNEIIVNQPIDTVFVLNKIDEVFNEVPIEKAIVETKNIKNREKRLNEEKHKENVMAGKIENVTLAPKASEDESQKNIKNKVISIAVKQSFSSKETISFKKALNNKTNIVKIKNGITIKEESKKETLIKQTKNSRIRVNSDDLLFAVTHSEQEVKNYYAKHNVTRDKVLKTIENELKKSNLKVNPETILAEVERTIGDDIFQNNFLKSLKKRISNIATVIASRND